MEEQPELITIRDFRDTAEAEMAKGRLRSAGIDCFLVGENSGVLYGNSIGSIQLQVNPDDESDARAVLDVAADPGDAERAEREDEAIAAQDKPIDAD
jgi:hypothetical protein